MDKVPVNRILPHSLVDGIGNRCTIFLQGCNISCRYCHNPETQKLCTGCGICILQCPAKALTLAPKGRKVIWQKERCSGCGQCLLVCPNYSSPKVTELSVDQMLPEIEKNIPFIRGITVSGGECALYLPFLEKLFQQCRRLGLTCFLDTNGTIALWEEPVMKYCDGVLLDVKAWSEELFHSLTGGSNQTVKENVMHLAELGKLEEIRIVCVQGHVDAEVVLNEVAACIKEEIREHLRVKLIAFRNAGVRGEWSQLKSPGRQYLEQLQKTAVSLGFHNSMII